MSASDSSPAADRHVRRRRRAGQARSEHSGRVLQLPISGSLYATPYQSRPATDRTASIIRRRQQALYDDTLPLFLEVIVGPLARLPVDASGAVSVCADDDFGLVGADRGHHIQRGHPLGRQVHA